MPQVAVAALAIGGEAVGAAIVSTSIATFATTTIVGQLLMGVALTEISRALAPTPKVKSGVQSTVTMTEAQPESFIVGKYATAGWLAAPFMTHGTNNEYLTQVIELSGASGCALSRVKIGSEWVTLGPDNGSGYGQPVVAGTYVDANGVTQTASTYAGVAWVKFYDGTQTVADPMLVSTYGSDPNRPWSSDMIGTGICYVIMTFKYDRQVMSSVPKCLFELDGIKLYDPRLDSTVGGTGSQRWGTPSTYTTTENPMVIAYNILRGITVGADTWGGECTAADLPLSNWFAAMNACDATVTNPDTTTEAAYRCGLEVTLDSKPADVLDAIKACCSAEFAETGGIFTVRVGAPAVASWSFTDDDVVISSPDQLTPFPGLDKTYNAISADYPDPASFYANKSAPLRTDTTYQTADGGRYLNAKVTFKACPFPHQVQRLQKALLLDDRRFLQHQVTLPPDAAVLAPLDSVSWTSAINGYTAKTFEVVQVMDDLATGCQVVQLRERDSSDYAFVVGDYLSSTSGGVTVTIAPPAQVLASWAAVGVTVPDSLGLRNLSALKVSWADPGTADVQAILIEVEGSAGTLISSSLYNNVANGFAIITDGIVGGNSYQVRGKIVPYSARATAWSAWLPVTAPTVTYPATSPAPTFWDAVTALEAAAATGGILPVATLPASSTVDGQVVMKLPEILLYKWDMATTTWVPIKSTITAGQVITSMLAAGAVTTDKISALAITTALLAAGAVTADKMTVTDLSAISANLGSISVDNAHIGTAAVDTLKIAGQSATIALYSGQTVSIPAGNTTNFAYGNFTMPDAGEVIIFPQIDVSQSLGSTSSGNFTIRIYIDGTLLFQQSYTSTPPGSGGSYTLSAHYAERVQQYVGAGAHSVFIQVYAGTVASVSASGSLVTLVSMR